MIERKPYIIWNDFKLCMGGGKGVLHQVLPSGPSHQVLAIIMNPFENPFDKSFLQIIGNTLKYAMV